MENEFNSNKHFVAGFIAGMKDKETGKPRDAWIIGDTIIQWNAGYNAAWDRKGRLVVELFPAE